jgi:hypothetical protein
VQAAFSAPPIFFKDSASHFFSPPIFFKDSASRFFSPPIFSKDSASRFYPSALQETPPIPVNLELYCPFIHKYSLLLQGL